MTDHDKVLISTPVFVFNDQGCPVPSHVSLEALVFRAVVVFKPSQQTLWSIDRRSFTTIA